MPQYELEDVGPARFTGLARGRTPEEAVRRAADVGDAPAVEVRSPDGPDGWQDVVVDGAAAGRVRLHGRMRFRRD